MMFPERDETLVRLILRMRLGLRRGRGRGREGSVAVGVTFLRVSIGLGRLGMVLRVNLLYVGPWLLNSGLSAFDEGQVRSFVAILTIARIIVLYLALRSSIPHISSVVHGFERCRLMS